MTDTSSTSSGDDTSPAAPAAPVVRDFTTGAGYPDGAVGVLMRQRDQAAAEAEGAQSLSEYHAQRVVALKATAEQMQTLIDQLGGEPSATE
jgi:hypothetical protein